MLVILAKNGSLSYTELKKLDVYEYFTILTVHEKQVAEEKARYGNKSGH